MIARIRNMMKGKFITYILWVALIAIPGGSLLIGVLDWFSNKSGKSPIARINGLSVSRFEFQSRVAMLEQRIQEIKSQLGSLSGQFLAMIGLQDKSSHEIVLQGLVQGKLLESAAHKIGINTLSIEYVEKKLADYQFIMKNLSEIIPPFVFNNKNYIDSEVLKKYLRQQGISVKEFEHIVEQGLIQNFMLELVQSIGYLTQSSLKRIMLEKNALRKFAVLEFELAAFLNQVVKKNIDHDELVEFFVAQNALSKRYVKPESRNAVVWDFAVSNYDFKILEHEIISYYRVNKNRFENKSIDDVREFIIKNIKEEKFKARFTADVKRVLKDKEAIKDFITKRRGKKRLVASDSSEKKTLLHEKIMGIKDIGSWTFIVDASGGHLIQIEKIEKSAEYNLDDIRDQVLNDFQHDLAKKMMDEAMESVCVDLVNNNIKEVARTRGATISQLIISGEQDQQWLKLDDKLYPIAKMKKIIHPGYCIRNSASAHGVVVVLEEIEGPDSPVSFIPHGAEAKKMKAQEMQFLIPSFIASLQNSATIEIEDSLTNN